MLLCAFLLLAAWLQDQEGLRAGSIQGRDSDRGDGKRTEGRGSGGSLQASDQNDGSQLGWAGSKQRCGLPTDPMKRCKHKIPKEQALQKAQSLKPKHTALSLFTTEGYQCPYARMTATLCKITSLKPDVMMDDRGWRVAPNGCLTTY